MGNGSATDAPLDPPTLRRYETTPAPTTAPEKRLAPKTTPSAGGVQSSLSAQLQLSRMRGVLNVWRLVAVATAGCAVGEVFVMCADEGAMWLRRQEDVPALGASFGGSKWAEFEGDLFDDTDVDQSATGAGAARSAMESPGASSMAPRGFDAGFCGVATGVPLPVVIALFVLVRLAAVAAAGWFERVKFPALVSRPAPSASVASTTGAGPAATTMPNVAALQSLMTGGADGSAPGAAGGGDMGGGWMRYLGWARGAFTVVSTLWAWLDDIAVFVVSLGLSLVVARIVAGGG